MAKNLSSLIRRQSQILRPKKYINVTQNFQMSVGERQIKRTVETLTRRFWENTSFINIATKRWNLYLNEKLRIALLKVNFLNSLTL